MCKKKSQSLLEPTNICKNGNYGVKFFGTEPIISLLYGHFFHQLNLMSCMKTFNGKSLSWDLRDLNKLLSPCQFSFALSCIR